MARRMLALIAIMSCSACRDDGPAASEAQSYWFLPAVAKQLDAAGRLPGTRPQRFTDSEISAELSRNWAPWVISWAVTQSQSAGERTAVLALPKGKPTQWVVRPADSASVELDSLMDIGVTPAVLRVLRRRTEAATSQEFPQTQNQRDPRLPVAPLLTIVGSARGRANRKEDHHRVGGAQRDELAATLH